MKNKSIREMVMASLFISLGLVLPFVFHFYGQGLGRVFLPMHIPILIAGFVLSMPYAIAVGVLTPLLSSFITGMPPMFPVLPYMIFELAAYAAVINILSRKIKWNTYICLIVGMVAGRIVAGIVVWVMVVVFSVNILGPIAWVISAVTAGIPGIVIQLIIIPPMIILLKKTKIMGNEVLGIE